MERIPGPLRSPMERIPRPLRPLCVAAAAWLGLFAVVYLVLLGAGVVARWAGEDPRLHGQGWPAITHLRLVDDRLLVGGETTPEQYRELAEHGVTLVIDARTGGAADETTDDPEQLAELGIDYVSLPVPDGRAPTTGQIRRFLDTVDGADGRVFAHCGGGVGRATSLAAVYEAAQGEDPSVLEQIATGPPSLEQIWFVATLSPDHPEHHISPAIAVVSRIVDSPRAVFGWVKSLF
jgi:uncharacterized protein (TIGR01244 family)